MASLQVFFQFLGSEEIPTHTISVNCESLQQHPDSLLTKLYDDKWKKKGSEKGSTLDDPIVTVPLESLEGWLPGMAIMIETFYKTSEFVLPKHVELEEAVPILDFYGLPVQDPQTVKFDETDVATEVRAKLWIERSKNYQATVDAILDKFRTEPEVEKQFVFFGDNNWDSNRKAVTKKATKHSLASCAAREQLSVDPRPPIPRANGGGFRSVGV